MDWLKKISSNVLSKDTPAECDAKRKRNKDRYEKAMAKIDEARINEIEEAEAFESDFRQGSRY